jgi:predicted GNAT family acetyltransferase
MDEMQGNALNHRLFYHSIEQLDGLLQKTRHTAAAAAAHTRLAPTRAHISSTTVTASSDGRGIHETHLALDALENAHQESNQRR